jgi:hypothetical protein
MLTESITMYTGYKISPSLSHVIETGEGKMERARGSKTLYALSLGSLPLPPYTLVGWPPTCVFVMVNEAQRYLATSIDYLIFNAVCTFNTHSAPFLWNSLEIQAQSVTPSAGVR